MTRKALQTRALAAVVYLLTHSGGFQQLLIQPLQPKALWDRLRADKDWADVAGALGEDPRHFVRRWGKQFLATGSVFDKPKKKKAGKGSKISAAEAALAAMYLKTGYWVPVQYRTSVTLYNVHRYYPSIRRACSLCPELRAIRDKYNLNNKQLLYHMKAADPHLARRTIRVRKAFDPEELAVREKRATTLYNRCIREQGWRDRTYFVDECSIWLDNVTQKGTKVYCDEFDKGYQTVIHYNKLHAGRPIKARFMVAVNAVHGLVYLEFTTGTTSITHYHNGKPDDPQYGPYKRKEPPHKVARATTQEEFEDNMCILAGMAHRHWSHPASKPLFCYDNASIFNQARFARMGFAHHQRIKIPPRSSDFNKPIEHVFHQVKDKLRQKLYECTAEVTPQLVQDWVADTCFTQISTASIAADVQSLKKTYLAVKTPKGVAAMTNDGDIVDGSGGDFGAAHLC